MLLSFCVGINAPCTAFTAKLPISYYMHVPKSNPKSDISDNIANTSKQTDKYKIMSISCYKLMCMMYIHVHVNILYIINEL